MEAAVRAGETVGVAFVEPEQASLFNVDLTCAVSTTQGTALYEDEGGPAAFARIVAAGSFAALDVKMCIRDRPTAPESSW